MPADRPTPEQLFGGRYELREVLGRGATSEVLAGWDRHLDRPVAVKLMRPDMASDPVLRRRFDMEARAAGRLSHPNVVTVYDTGDLGPASSPYIVMERLSGATLRDTISSGPLADAEGRELAVQMLAALAVAHRAGLVHRDIKPGNVLRAAPGHWKVADFGTAKALDSLNEETSTGLVVGTPAYLAPERLYGRPATVASDLFSVGVVLFEALTGSRPFETSSAYPWSGVLDGRGAAPLRSLRPDVDPVLAAVVERSLRLDPRDRYTSAAAMAAALVAPRSDAVRPGRPARAAGMRPLTRIGVALTGAGTAAAVAVGLSLLGGAPTSAARFGASGDTVQTTQRTTPKAVVAPVSTTPVTRAPAPPPSGVHPTGVSAAPGSGSRAATVSVVDHVSSSLPDPTLAAPTASGAPLFADPN